MESIELWSTGPHFGDLEPLDPNGPADKVEPLAAGHHVGGTIKIKSVRKLRQKISDAGGIGEFQIVLEGTFEASDSVKAKSNHVVKSIDRSPVAGLLFGGRLQHMDDVPKEKSRTVTFYREILGNVMKETDSTASFQLPIRTQYLPPSFTSTAGTISYTLTAVHPGGIQVSKSVKVESWPMFEVQKFPEGACAATLGELLAIVSVAPEHADIVVPSSAKPARLTFSIRFARAPPSYEDSESASLSPSLSSSSRAASFKSRAASWKLQAPASCAEVGKIKVEVKYRLRAYTVVAAEKITLGSYGEKTVVIDVGPGILPFEREFHVSSYDICTETPGGPVAIPARKHAFNADAPPMDPQESWVFQNCFFLEVDLSSRRHHETLQVPVSLQINPRKRDDFATPGYVVDGV